MSIKKENLVFYYDGINNMGEGLPHDNNTTIWYDLSGNGNNASVNGCMWGGDSVILEGNSSSPYTWVYCGNHTLPNASQATLEMLCQTPIVGTNTMYMGGNGGNSASGSIYLAQYNNNYEGRSIASSLYSAAAPAVSKELALLSVVVNGNSLRLYKNGVLAKETIASRNFSVNNTSYCFVIGGLSYSQNSISTGNMYRGRVFSHRLYSVALTDEEISDNFDAEMERYNKAEAEVKDTDSVSKIKIKNEKTYNVKDTYSRINKINKNEDDTVVGIINFINGIKINQANINYDNDVIIFS